MVVPSYNTADMSMVSKWCPSELSRLGPHQLVSQDLATLRLLVIEHASDVMQGEVVLSELHDQQPLALLNR